MFQNHQPEWIIKLFNHPKRTHPSASGTARGGFSSPPKLTGGRCGCVPTWGMDH